MSRTRFIYFLSAIVLIIGCFALNTSYSLFVDNDSTQLVETTVPTITDEVTLSLPSVEVEGTKEYLIKQTITNNNSIPIGFRLTASSDSTTYQVQSTTYEDDNYLSYGTVEANSTKDIYLRVANTNEDTSNIATINFSLESDYATLKMNTEEYLASANIDNQTQFEIVLGDLPYSDNQDTLTYKIIQTQMNKFSKNTLSDESISSYFNESTKIELPFKQELNVPSPTSFSDVETEEVGLYKTEDDYGMSYYYRGASSINYVDFAGFIWRIVRINGDGSIRLILESTLDKVKQKDENDFVYKNKSLLSIDDDGNVRYDKEYDEFNNNDISYIGYMYGNFNGNSKNYDEAHKNYKSSTIKEYIDKFYEEYLMSYQNYLSDSMFCSDKTHEPPHYSTGVYGTNSVNFNALIRMQYYPSKPTLKCAQKNELNNYELSDIQLSYSRYTSKVNMDEYTNLGVLVNNDLEYPIALLSIDEVIFAGTTIDNSNNSYYLYGTSDSVWWTMSPAMYELYLHVFSVNSKWGPSYNTYSFNEFGVRPVINLKSTVLWDSGDGSQGNPYRVKLNEEA